MKGGKKVIVEAHRHEGEGIVPDIFNAIPLKPSVMGLLDTCRDLEGVRRGRGFLRKH